MGTKVQPDVTLPAIPVQPSAADQSQPALPAGWRLVPALIGRKDNAHTAWLPCPTWCDIDHVAERQVAVEDVWHSGPWVDLEMPHRDGHTLLAYFRLGVDPYSKDPAKRRPFVFGEDGDSSVGRHMDPEHVEEMCDKAEATIARLRAMAQAARALAAGGVV